MKIRILVLVLWLSPLIIFAQNINDEVLFTVDNSAVKVSEFVRVYKKNLDLVKDEDQKDVDAYLDLFVNYKLKVKEAYAKGLNEDPQYRRELKNYKAQLTKSFLAENKVTDALVEEAYNRMQYDIKASHILIMLDEIEQDTTAVYNDMLELRERCLKEGFDVVFKDLNSNYKVANSQSLKYNGRDAYAEHLGYFSTFKMVYPFETAAYNTKVGEVSMPFRTRFGYHIVKVEDKRVNRGTVTVAHIMVSNNQKDTSVDPKNRIEDLYQKIQQGDNFESLAKQFSDDNSSANKGGLLSPFKGGQLSSTVFEDEAFALKEEGQVSKPFKSDYGWHIVKLIKKEPLASFDVMKPQLEQQVKRDARSNLINSALAEQLKQTYKVEENKNALSYFKAKLNDDYFKRSWTFPKDENQLKTILSIEDKKLTYKDFGAHLMQSQRKYFNKQVPFETIVESEYSTFLEDKLIQFREDNLEFENEEFAHVLNEYRDGLLLFDLMEQEVWNKASRDTLGLKTFFENNQSNYVWDERVDAAVFSCSNQADLKTVIKLLKSKTSADEITKQLNTKEAHKVFVTKGIMDASHQALPKGFNFEEGISESYQQNDAYHVVFVNEVLPKGNKTLEEAKGIAISDYQAYLEKNWLDDLHNKYKVVINNEVLQKVKSQILN